MSMTKSITQKNNYFYLAFFRIMSILVLQNMITFSVNVADNIMLGSYSQNALSGAAAVNQIQFLLQQITLGLGEGLVALASQYWGRKDVKSICHITWIALLLGISVGFLLTAAACVMPAQILRIFTSDLSISQEGLRYLTIMKFTYLPFIITSICLACLRSMETVKIGFYISCVTLIINIAINYLLIFGKFGAPELGIAGAAIGTLCARLIEVCIIMIYFIKKYPNLLRIRFAAIDKKLWLIYMKTSAPIVITQSLFGLSVSMQTAVLGHLSSDAIAANSAATTIFQYLKLIAIGSSSATLILIGKEVGSGQISRLKEYKRNLQFIYLGIGLTICFLLQLIRQPLLNLYTLTVPARELAAQIILLLSITAIGTAYQMPVNTGIIRGSGDTSFALKLDLISIWGFVYPLSLLAAFVWKLPIIVVVTFLNSDQLFKCIPAFIKVNKYFRISSI